MIYKHSRYTNTKTYKDYRNGEEVTTFELREYAKFDLEDSITHVWTSSNTLWGLAHMYYNDAQLWWVIPDCNPSIDILNMQDGTVLVLPSLEEVEKLYG